MAIAAAVFAIAGAFTYSDKAGNLNISAASAAMTRDQAGNMTLRLRGTPVVAVGKAEGIDLRAASVVAQIASGAGGRSTLKSAKGMGGVTVVKSVVAAMGSRTTEIKGSNATYTAGKVESLVALTGGVSIRNLDSAKRQSLFATGSSGSARLEPATSTKRDNGLIGAMLQGDVRVVLNEAGAKGASSVVATGDRMVLDNRPGAPTVTLTGNVHVQGQGHSTLGDIRGVGRVVLRLDAKENVKGLETGAE